MKSNIPSRKNTWSMNLQDKQKKQLLNVTTMNLQRNYMNAMFFHDQEGRFLIVNCYQYWLTTNIYGTELSSLEIAC